MMQLLAVLLSTLTLLNAANPANAFLHLNAPVTPDNPHPVHATDAPAVLLDGLRANVLAQNVNPQAYIDLLAQPGNDGLFKLDLAVVMGCIEDENFPLLSPSKKLMCIIHEALRTKNVVAFDKIADRSRHIVAIYQAGIMFAALNHHVVDAVDLLYAKGFNAPAGANFGTYREHYNNGKWSRAEIIRLFAHPNFENFAPNSCMFNTVRDASITIHNLALYEDIRHDLVVRIGDRAVDVLLAKTDVISDINLARLLAFLRLKGCLVTQENRDYFVAVPGVAFDSYEEGAPEPVAPSVTHPISYGVLTAQIV